MDNVVKLNPQHAKMVGDSLVNFSAGMGITGRDKRKGAVFVGSGRMRFDELEALYEEDGLAGKIVDIIAEDMTKKGRTFEDSDLLPEERGRLLEAEKKFQVFPKLAECKKWSRLYGGAIIVINVDDGVDPSQPLEIDKLKPGSLKSLVVYDRRNVTPHRINRTDPQKDNFHLPETYRLVHTTGEIHYSRVIRMDGIATPYHVRIRNEYWGNSVLQRLRDALVNLNTAIDSTAGLLFESNVDVIGVENLLTSFASTEATNALIKRFQEAKFLKSNNRITVHDKDRETITKLTNTFSGIEPVLKIFLTLCSSMSDIPVTRLIGISPGGLNATGDGDLTNYYDSLEANQEFELRPVLERLDLVLAANEGIDPDKLRFTFNPLWQMSDIDKATVLEKLTISLDKLVMLGVLTPSLAAIELKNKKLVTCIDDDHIKRLKKLEAELDAEEASTEEPQDVTDPLENPNEDEPSAEETKDGKRRARRSRRRENIQKGTAETYSSN